MADTDVELSLESDGLRDSVFLRWNQSMPSAEAGFAEFDALACIGGLSNVHVQGERIYASFFIDPTHPPADPLVGGILPARFPIEFPASATIQLDNFANAPLALIWEWQGPARELCKKPFARRIDLECPVNQRCPGIAQFAVSVISLERFFCIRRRPIRRASSQSGRLRAIASRRPISLAQAWTKPRSPARQYLISVGHHTDGKPNQ